MNQKRPTPSTDHEKIWSQVRSSTPPGIVEIIATQSARAEEAKRRIDEEGIVVRDVRGSVIAHPAIAIEIAAGKIVCDLLAKHRVSNIR